MLEEGRRWPRDGGEQRSVHLGLSLPGAPIQKWARSHLSRGKGTGMDGWHQTGVVRMRRSLKCELRGQRDGPRHGGELQEQMPAAGPRCNPGPTRARPLLRLAAS